MTKIYFKIIIFLLIILGGFSFYVWRINADAAKLLSANGENGGKNIAAEPAEKIKADVIKNIEITENSTYDSLMKSAGVDCRTSNEIFAAAAPFYDLSKIKTGHFLELTYGGEAEDLKKFNYKIDSEDELRAEKTVKTASSTDALARAEEYWTAKVAPIPYEVKTVTKGGTVESSMYQAAIDNNIDIRAIIDLANAFQWSIDFAMDPRQGDTFKFVYEEKYLNGKYVMPGKILAGKYINDGHEYYVYYFEENKNNKGFFDENGNSVQKMFLKAPVEFKYISSGFTTGLRYIKAFNISTGHRAVDYAAQSGTPIRAVGDGTITFAGWSSAGYGNLVSIHHNSTYSTNYGHQSKIAAKRGQKVKQGDIIGYVGSTGLSTGPHLHYEMVKNGVKINPLLEVLPPGTPIKEENKARFFEEIEKYKKILAE